MKPFIISILLFASTVLASEYHSQVGNKQPITQETNLPTATIPISDPEPEPESTDSTKSSSIASSTPTNCYIDGPCDCDEDDPDYFQCITNANCRPCFLGSRSLTPLTSTTIQCASLAPSSASTSTSSDGQEDKCWIGGPCDCSLLEEYSEPWYACIDNPACVPCFLGGRTLTPRSSTVPVTTSSTSSSVGEDTTTNFETMPPGTYAVTSSGTVVVVIVTDEATSLTGEPAGTVDVRTRTTVVV